MCSFHEINLKDSKLYPHESPSTLLMSSWGKTGMETERDGIWAWFAEEWSWDHLAMSWSYHKMAAFLNLLNVQGLQPEGHRAVLA